MKTLKKTDEEKLMHAGHRARMLECFEKGGLAGFSEVQVVEFFLTYIFPRGDVNPLAHRLLNRFNNFASILDADIADLQSVKGIGKRAAVAIHGWAVLTQEYLMSAISEKEFLGTHTRLYDFVENLLRMEKEECFYMIGMNASFHLCGFRCLARGNLTKVGIKNSEVTKFLNSVDPVFVVMAHNHPGGKCLASEQDYTATEHLSDLLIRLEKTYVDHLIVGIDGIFSVKNKEVCREFKPL